MEIISIPTITIISYLVGEFFKMVVLRKKRRFKYIPLIVGVTGGILGLILYYVNQELLPNPISAIAIGIVSGLASTGSNELIKQIKKKGKD